MVAFDCPKNCPINVHVRLVKFSYYKQKFNSRNILSPENICLVGGYWSVVGGRWSVVCGRWSVVGGRWSVLWSVVGGFVITPLIHNNSVITDDKELTSLFNDHYINVVEKTTGVKPFCISDGNSKNKNEFICDIISRYKNHPSIVKVKEMILHNEAFPQLFNF